VVRLVARCGCGRGVGKETDAGIMNPQTAQGSLEAFQGEEFAWFSRGNMRDTVATVVAVETPDGRPIVAVNNADALDKREQSWNPTQYRTRKKVRKCRLPAKTMG
jgi:hypothetical protein